MEAFTTQLLTEREDIAEAMSRFSQEGGFQIAGSTARIGTFEGTATVIVEGEGMALVFRADGGRMLEFSGGGAAGWPWGDEEQSGADG
jgi:hypothetical protein